MPPPNRQTVVSAEMTSALARCRLVGSELERLEALRTFSCATPDPADSLGPGDSATHPYLDVLVPAPAALARAVANLELVCDLTGPTAEETRKPDAIERALAALASASGDLFSVVQVVDRATAGAAAIHAHGMTRTLEDLHATCFSALNDTRFAARNLTRAAGLRL